MSDKYIPYKHMLCNGCLIVKEFSQEYHNCTISCESCGSDFCGCEGCIASANSLAEGFRKAADTGLLNDIDYWCEETGCKKVGELKESADVAKCSGLGCAFKEVCGRYLRPEAENQTWGAFYALPDDDCQYFEVINQDLNNEQT